MKKFLLSTVVVCATAPSLYAGVISNACINSDRPATAQLCSCIQQAADLTLGSSDQRRAASFFRDPNLAQEVRASASDRDNQFWDRYHNFGQTAEAMCAS
ncbi:hypothetical protein [Acidimangrovimonas sediminis]|uniref:hypothetical protein n=1 Tax=Acidimangrovimonas sediminis TaxID=2056283 RepID=UPI000C810348|nr:hypothetical protein [Acidimangrovimonas sediminis]